MEDDASTAAATRAEVAAAISAFEEVLDRHSAHLTEEQARDLVRRLAVAGRRVNMCVRRIEEAKAKADPSIYLYRGDYCHYGSDCGAHGGAEIVPCFACNSRRECWKSAAY